MVGRTTVVDRPERLHSVLDVLSDECWFDPDEDISHDEARGAVVVRFLRQRLDEREFIAWARLRRQWRVPVDEVLLNIYRARNVVVQDLGGQGGYAFGEVTYRPDDRIVSVVADDKTAFRLMVEVDDLQIEVVETGVVVGSTTRRSVL